MMQAVTCACVFRSRYLGHRTIFFQGTLRYVLNNGLAFSKVRSTNVSEHKHKLTGSCFTVKTGLHRFNFLFFSLVLALILAILVNVARQSLFFGQLLQLFQRPCALRRDSELVNLSFSCACIGLLLLLT